MALPTAPAASPVGFVGLGRMGSPIARRLLDRGVPLVVHNRSRPKAEELLALGARWAETPAALAREVDGGVVFTLLTDAKAVRAVLFGRTGLARGARPGTLVVDLSTVAPAESRALAARLVERGIGFVDAPLGGSVAAATGGTLLVYAGGAAADIDRARPLLSIFARRVEALGGVGAGTSMKLVNNLLTVAHVALAAEALALAGGLGLDRERVLDLLLDGGGQSRMLADKREAFSRRDYPARFTLALAAKDLGLIDRTARDVGGSVPLAHALRRWAQAAARSGLAEKDLSALLEASIGRFPAASPAAAP
ncbi:MAG TPA: NAD(P)-dependent oxidoreductase [Thermoplasmata archaeon]|nr:NAD(P)-dependent oxidoreductase [Thermoplasmata archaeon]